MILIWIMATIRFSQIVILCLKEGYLTAREYFIGFPNARSKVIHRKIVERGLYFPEGIWSCDLACMPMIALIEDVKIYYLKQPLYYYNQTNDSTARVSDFRVSIWMC